MSSKSPAHHNPKPDDSRCFVDTHGVITTTANDLPTHRTVRVLGTVYGLTVRSRNLGANFGAAMKSIVGGELKPLTHMLYAARNEAVDRLVGECLARGGNAVLALRFDAGEIEGAGQVCAYGTACVVEEIGPVEKNVVG